MKNFENFEKTNKKNNKNNASFGDKSDVDKSSILDITRIIIIAIKISKKLAKKIRYARMLRNRIVERKYKITFVMCFL